jgi:hypothetical protein
VQAEMELDNRAMTRQVIELSQQVERLSVPADLIRVYRL